MIASWVTDVLRCPTCRGALCVDGESALSCGGCGGHYPLTPMPVLLEGGRVAPPAPTLSRETLEARWAKFRRRPWIGDEMIDALPSGAVVLSVGEGYGEIVLRLAERRPDLRFVAVDLTAQRIAWARDLQARMAAENCWFCVADATRLPFADRAFTAGYARGLLQVFPDPAEAIAELCRTVRSRLFVDQLGNRPFLTMWFRLFQYYENVRARLRGRPPNRRIWGEIEETLQLLGTYWPLPQYRRWFPGARRVHLRANCVAVWETGQHHAWLGWFGYAGALDVWL